MKRAQTMRKARMLRRLIREMRESELTNAPQTLKLPRINQTDEQSAFIGICFEADDIVNRVPVNSFCQYFSPCFNQFWCLIQQLSSREVEKTYQKKRLWYNVKQFLHICVFFNLTHKEIICFLRES